LLFDWFFFSTSKNVEAATADLSDCCSNQWPRLLLQQSLTCVTVAANLACSTVTVITDLCDRCSNPWPTWLLLKSVSYVTVAATPDLSYCCSNPWPVWLLPVLVSQQSLTCVAVAAIPDLCDRPLDPGASAGVGTSH
jgi:hypothetical protein